MFKIRYLLIFTFLIPFLIQGQDLSEQIDSLKWMASGEGVGERMPTAKRILEREVSNFEAHKYIVKTYRNLGEEHKAYRYIDSILDSKNQVAEILMGLAYGLGHGAPRDSVYDYYYFRVLQEALNFPSSKAKALFFLSLTYYADFIKPTKKEAPIISAIEYTVDSVYLLKQEELNAELMGVTLDSFKRYKSSYKLPEPKSTYAHSADSAMKYLSALSLSKSKYSNAALIPLQQLKCYLNHSCKEDLDSNLYIGHYMPEWYFGHLPKGWSIDYTVDLFEEIVQRSSSKVRFLSKHLIDLEEPVLYKNSELLSYRIIWLPSFDHPISIRFQMESNTEASITWKVGSGKGGYEPEGILSQGREKIEVNDFRHVAKILEERELDYKDSYDYLPILDGATLIVERSSQKGYKAHETNVASRITLNFILTIAQKYFKEIETGIKDYSFEESNN